MSISFLVLYIYSGLFVDISNNKLCHTQDLFSLYVIKNLIEINLSDNLFKNKKEIYIFIKK